VTPTLLRQPAAKPLTLPPRLAAPDEDLIATLKQTRSLKRAMDVVLGMLGAIVALPLAAIIAAAIWLESGGPILFRQTRVGRAGRLFQILKFRTMVVDGDEVLAQYLATDALARLEWRTARKLRRDPRITRVGRFLRRTSLDELPQLINVLRGEMSLAGPRPIVENEIARYGAAFPFYALVTPGLTGLWQVSGRNDTSYRTRIELDIAYVRNWSVWRDLAIFLKTIRVVLVGKGAY